MRPVIGAASFMRNRSRRTYRHISTTVRATKRQRRQFGVTQSLRELSPTANEFHAVAVIRSGTRVLTPVRLLTAQQVYANELLSTRPEYLTL